jgi:hypothetical protein
MTLRRFINSFVIENLDEFPKEEIPVSMSATNEDDTVFKKYFLNSLKKRKSKMKTLTIGACNSNNNTCYSVFSGQSEAVELGYEFGGIDDSNLLFKWERYLNRYFISIFEISLFIF